MNANTQAIVEAARQLERGELVAFPTETVYGLGADAENAEAVAQIFALKGRPQDHPLIVHIAGTAHLAHWAREVPELASSLMKAFWPGPLTLVLKKQPGVADACTGGQDTIGLRSPSHPVAQALLREFKKGLGGIAAPSANKFGKVSPTTARHVQDAFGDALTVLEGGACEVGIESTIVDCSRPELGAVLLRPGMVTVTALQAALGDKALVVQGHKAHEAPRVSGALPAHYQPDTPVRIIDIPHNNYGDYKCPIGSIRVLMALEAIEDQAWLNAHGIRQVRVLSDDPRRYAHDLYAALRELDAQGYDEILVQAPPATSDWLAINDRLQRAAYR